MAGIPPFSIPFPLHGEEDFMVWRRSLRSYLMKYNLLGLVQLDLKDEAQVPLYILQAMNPFPRSLIHGLDRISDVWVMLNGYYLPRIPREDMLDMAGLDGTLQHLNSEWEKAIECFYCALFCA